MAEIITTPTHRPKCPNHSVALDGIPFPLPKKGEGICPVSGAHFSFEVEGDDTKTGVTKDKFGGTSKTGVWKIRGND